MLEVHEILGTCDTFARRNVEEDVHAYKFLDKCTWQEIKYGGLTVARSCSYFCTRDIRINAYLAVCVCVKKKFTLRWQR